MAKFLYEIFETDKEGLRKYLSSKSENGNIFKIYYKNKGFSEKLKPFVELARKVFDEEEFEALLN